MGAAGSVAPRLWPGATFVCIGGGPSLTREDVEFCHGRARVIAVNDAYKVAPWADVLYAHDPKWWDLHQGVPSFTGLKFSLNTYWTAPAAKKYGVDVLKIADEHGLSLDPAKLTHGKNSGYQAVNLAVHLGARRIVLLGYDMCPSDDGRKHWFGNHPNGVQCGMPFHMWRTNFQSLEAPLQQLGVEVLNCSRRTALDCFPRMPLEEAL